MFSSLRLKGTLFQIIHAAYAIVCFPLLVRTFFYVKVLFRCIPGIVLESEKIWKKKTNAVVYDNFANFQRTGFGRVRDEKEKLSRTRDLRAPPIKRATLHR